MAEAIEILIDADACPVKDETYKVALRLQVPVTLVSNQFLRIPPHPLLKLITVSDGFDAADDEVVERAHDRSVVVTADILLAERALKKGAIVLGPNGRPFTENSIGSAIATRAIMADLRAGGDQVGGAAPFSKADRSRYLSALDEALNRLKRAHP